MDWTDDAIILNVRKHGESAAIVSLLTAEHGRHSGLVRGGGGRRARGVLQPGNGVRAQWRARLEEHLGTLSCELTDAVAARVLGDPLRLAALDSACTVADAALPEREAHPRTHAGLGVLMAALAADDPVWPTVYVKWEIGLLGALGFGLDLESCAATGGNDQLAYVSPKSGRAVSLTAGEPYRDRLLPLPAFLVSGNGAETLEEILDGLRLSGYFLDRHVFSHGRAVSPPARERLIERLRRSGI